MLSRLQGSIGQLVQGRINDGQGKTLPSEAIGLIARVTCLPKDYVGDCWAQLMLAQHDEASRLKDVITISAS
jgi:hypothetical protein